MIEVDQLTKCYGKKLAVDNISFTVNPGVVTGFLGPNGSGKSTTMRMIVGLDAPTSGRVTVNGRDYRQHPAPLREVGALLEARGVHTGRTAANHLRALAATAGIGKRRVAEVIDQVGLREVAGKRAGGFSLGMGQRLGIASALLADPDTLMLDEPVNGLDPDGVLWIRHLLRDLAAEGRTVFLSSHLMSEMALTAEHLVIIGRGRVLRNVAMAEFLDDAAPAVVDVRTPDGGRLADVLRGPGVDITSTEPGHLHIDGLTSDQIGALAAHHAVTLAELTPRRVTLEEAYMDLTADAVEYRGTTAPTPETISAGATGATSTGATT